MTSALNPPRLSVVVPAYNEEQRLPATLAQILEYLACQPYRSEVIVVDDGSLDQTPALVERMMHMHPTLSLLCLEHHGKGYAVRHGVLQARGEFILFSDADLAVPIEEWEKLESLLRTGYDVVIGSREGLGAKRQGEPPFRHIMGRVFNLIVRVIAVNGIRDTQCGFKAFRRSAAVDIFRRVHLYGERAHVIKGPAVTAFDVEVLFLARLRGYLVAEVPIVWNYGMETKVNPLRDSVRNLRDVLVIRWNALHGVYQSSEEPLPNAPYEELTP